MPPSRDHVVDPELANYIAAHSQQPDEVQRRLMAVTKETTGGAATMQIGGDQGTFFEILARTMGARTAIEIGTFTGYSALSIARGLGPEGRLICCDVSEEWTRIAQEHWALAGVADRIDLRLGPALATLDALLAEGGAGRWDLAFIDADKPNYDGYYERCLTLLRPGGLVLIDNVLWSGAVADPARTDANTTALRALNAKLHGDERVTLAMLPIGDGLTLARKRG